MTRTSHDLSRRRNLALHKRDDPLARLMLTRRTRRPPHRLKRDDPAQPRNSNQGEPMTFIAIAGNLTHDAETKFTPQGTGVTSFTVAVNKRLKNTDGEWVDGEPSFYRCSFWGNRSAYANGLKKGQAVVVIGDLEIRQFERKDGTKGTTANIKVREVGVNVADQSRIRGTEQYAAANATPAPAPTSTASAWDVPAEPSPF